MQDRPTCFLHTYFMLQAVLLAHNVGQADLFSTHLLHARSCSCPQCRTGLLFYCPLQTYFMLEAVLAHNAGQADLFSTHLLHARSCSPCPQYRTGRLVLYTLTSCYKLFLYTMQDRPTCPIHTYFMLEAVLVLNAGQAYLFSTNLLHATSCSCPQCRTGRLVLYTLTSC